MKLWYKEPAENFNEALPIGNGKLGAMVYGGALCELLELNEDSLWSGYDRPQEQKPGAPEAVAKARELIFAGDYLGAHEILREKVLCKRLEAYQPLGNLIITLETRGEVSDYSRNLDIDKAMAGVEFKAGNANITREYFCSAPHNALFIRIKSDTQLEIGVNLTSLHPHTVKQENDVIEMRGRLPVAADPDYLENGTQPVYDDEKNNRAIEFHARAAIKRSKSEAIIIIQATSSLRGELPPVPQGSWDELYAAHITDYAPLFGRVELSLGEGANALLPTTERLELYQTKPEDDPSLPVLLFQYGRYLLISSAREGSNPPNLQGIWNNYRRPPWSCNYTSNINFEMNHWPAEPANLSESHMPMMEYIEKLAKNGEIVAKEIYGCGGWVAHHNVDGWHHAVPMGDWGNYESVVYGFWPMGGAWMARHMWEHYEYTLDKDFLVKRALPVMIGAARFMLDYLVEHDGYLVTCPSTSPENKFLVDGKPFSAAYASTMDMAIIRDLFTNTLSAIEVAGTQDAIKKEIMDAYPKLYPYKVGAKGQLQEWCEDFEEVEPRHRHVSHLYALYPGNSITQRGTQKLADACRKTLEFRGDGGTGWSLGWKINLWARLGDGDHAYKLIKRQLMLAGGFDTEYGHVGGGTYPNMLDAHPPFQIDGNFGAVSGITEMLLRSLNIGEIEILPALPTVWKDGSFKGLRAKGNIEVELDWKDCKPVRAVLSSDISQTIKLRFGDDSRKIVIKAGEELVIEY